MLNGIWAILGICGILWGLATGRGALLTRGALGAAMDAAQVCLRLAGGFALWSGMLAILEESGAIQGLTRLLAPLLGRLFPGASAPARQAISMNLTANLLGLGNAATPMGLEAMRRMGQEGRSDAASNAMCMFLVINAASLQLFPATVVALRAAAGSAEPASILLPTLFATGVSALVGVFACLGLQGFFRGDAP